jgi:spore coat polysaccharide biosynthesis protein SpsF (cytidylyltransferase family)
MDWNGAPMLQRIIERVSSSALSDKIIVATSNTDIDDSIELLCRKLHIDCFRGEEIDVLGRFVDAINFYDAKTVVRLTGDNPFVNGELVDYAISAYKKHDPSVDYLSNTGGLSFPYGLFVEIVNAKVLASIRKSASPEEAEHVTLRIRENPDIFTICELPADRVYPRISLTVDTPLDAMRLLPVFANLAKNNDDFGLAEIATL